MQPKKFTYILFKAQHCCSTESQHVADNDPSVDPASPEIN